MTPQSALAALKELLRRSLAARLIAIAAVSVVGLVAMGLVALAQFNAQMTRILIDPEISSVANELIGAAAPDREGRFSLRAPPSDPRYQQPVSGRYYQIARLGAGESAPLISPSLVDATLALPDDVLRRMTAAGATGNAQFLTIEGPDGEALRVVARVASLPELNGRYLVLVGVAPRMVVAPAGNLVGWALAGFVAFCALMVAATTLLQIRLGLKPLSDLRANIASVRRGDAERLSGDYPAELQPVAAELNALVDHNREVVERARRHVGNLAHALKTPIAVLKNAANEGESEAGVFKQSIEEMEAFVERQLRRARVAARADARAGAQASTIAYRTKVTPNLHDLVFMMEQKYDQKAMDIALEAEADVTFRGEREDLLEMAANLVDNACKYGKSRVIVRVLGPAKGVFDIVVEDDGPGLTEAEIARAMARGARLDEAAPGQGLGLSILKETVELYAGELAFSRSELGGLKALLRLPATD